MSPSRGALLFLALAVAVRTWKHAGAEIDTSCACDVHPAFKERWVFAAVSWGLVRPCMHAWPHTDTHAVHAHTDTHHPMLYNRHHASMHEAAACTFKSPVPLIYHCRIQRDLSWLDEAGGITDAMIRNISLVRARARACAKDKHLME